MFKSWFRFILILGLLVSFNVNLGYCKAVYNPVAGYEGPESDSNVQVPIPMKDRVPNKTGIQCVWSSLETLARYAKEKRLYDITELSAYKARADSDDAKRMLEKYGVRYEMTLSTRDRSLLIKGCTKERRGVAFSIPGHVMVLVHYDEKAGIVKYVNNSDEELKIRTWDMETFNQKWTGWATILYAKVDIIPQKYFNGKSLPIRGKKFNKNYILMPRLD